MFEKTIKDLYEHSVNSDVGYLILIENVFDAIQLYQLSQSAYFLNKLTILQYKFGLNNVTRAAGEFVCDRLLHRERLFSKTNKFYY